MSGRLEEENRRFWESLEVSDVDYDDLTDWVTENIDSSLDSSFPNQPISIARHSLSNSTPSPYPPKGNRPSSSQIDNGAASVDRRNPGNHPLGFASYTTRTPTTFPYGTRGFRETPSSANHKQSSAPVTPSVRRRDEDFSSDCLPTVTTSSLIPPTPSSFHSSRTLFHSPPSLHHERRSIASSPSTGHSLSARLRNPFDIMARPRPPTPESQGRKRKRRSSSYDNEDVDLFLTPPSSQTQPKQVGRPCPPVELVQITEMAKRGSAMNLPHRPSATPVQTFPAQARSPSKRLFPIQSTSPQINDASSSLNVSSSKSRRASVSRKTKIDSSQWHKMFGPSVKEVRAEMDSE